MGTELTWSAKKENPIGFFFLWASKQTASFPCEIRKTFRSLMLTRAKSTRRSIGESHHLLS